MGIDNVSYVGCISDLFCVASKLDFRSPSNHTAKQITLRQYNIIDRDQMEYDLLNTAFVSSLFNNDCDLYTQYISNISYALDQYAPLKTKCLTKPKPVWITQQFREAKQFRNQAERSLEKEPLLFQQIKAATPNQ